MNTIDELLTTNITVKPTDEYSTISTQSTNHDDLKSILAYAIPLSSLIIIFVLILIVGIRQRHRVLDKWISLKRMRNTNPRFLRSVGLRRDSEFDSFNHGDVNSTIENEENPSTNERQYHLATIS